MTLVFVVDCYLTRSPCSRDHYTRYGLAFLLEHGFMVRIAARLALRRHSTDARTPLQRTPKGRTCYQCVAALHFASML
jgi:hypothetical protein